MRLVLLTHPLQSESQKIMFLNTLLGTTLLFVFRGITRQLIQTIILSYLYG